jgi:hypothetical protein
MSDKDEQVSAMLVQKHQLEQSENKLSELDTAINALQQNQEINDDALDQMLGEMQGILSNCGIEFEANQDNYVSQEVDEYVAIAPDEVALIVDDISVIDGLDFNREMSWQHYVSTIESYAQSKGIDLTVDPFQTLMTPNQRAAFEKRVKDEFSLKAANCDKYDYMIAGTCGVIGGLIDVFFVGLPGEGKLTSLADDAVDGAVEKFASALGWSKEKALSRGSDTTASAISYLENGGNISDENSGLVNDALLWCTDKAGLNTNGNNKFTGFKVNYDQATTHGPNGTDGVVENLSPKNHHLKSLGHSPDLIGLFFSVLNQFTSTSSFVSNGKIITIDTETSELKGGTFVAKIFCGFVNWIGHLLSDVAGSSGASGRGAGIPIPFYNLLLLIDAGEFGKDRQTFAMVATKVFEGGYDFRHGLALAIPVLITELLTRMMWVVKQGCYHNKAWKDCIPSANNPELRRMLLVAHGSLCLIDAGDAAIRSGGDMVQFLLRTNIIGWTRFGHSAIKEVYAWYNAGHIDVDAVDEYLDAQYKEMLA